MKNGISVVVVGRAPPSYEVLVGSKVSAEDSIVVHGQSGEPPLVIDDVFSPNPDKLRVSCGHVQKCVSDDVDEGYIIECCPDPAGPFHFHCK